MRPSFLSVSAFAAGALALNCNGRAELCDKKYSNVTFIAAHDSPFVGILPTQNQFDDVETQLSKGTRFLTAQTHDEDGAIQMCHTSCILEDAGTLQDFLKSVKTFMDGNPDEVVTLLLTNGDAIDINKFGDAFKEVGLDTLGFAPNADLTLDEWPTLGELIANKQRLITFMDFHADTTKVPFILDEFKYYFETPFSPTEDEFSSCKLDRPNGGSPDGRMYIVNHNLNIELLPDVLIPDSISADKTNSVSSIMAHSDLCIASFGRNPNVMLLDYVSKGEAAKAADTMNGF